MLVSTRQAMINMGFGSITVKADVRYVPDGVGMGVRFMNLKPEDREWIKKFVERF